MKLYYTIWVDCILRAKSQPQNKNNWRFFTMLFMSMSMALNLWFISFILMLHLNFSLSIYPFKIDLFPATRIDAFVSFFLSYLLPPLLFNYFLIFHKNKYQELIKIYPYYEGRLFLKYFLGSLGIIAIYFSLAFLVVKVF